MLKLQTILKEWFKYITLCVALIYIIFSISNLYNYNLNNENWLDLKIIKDYVLKINDFKKEEITKEEIKDYMIKNNFNNEAISTIENSWIKVFAIKWEIGSDYYSRLENKIHLYWNSKEWELNNNSNTLLHELIHVIYYKNENINKKSTEWLKILINNNKEYVDLATWTRDIVELYIKEKWVDYVNKIVNQNNINPLIDRWNLYVLNSYSKDGSYIEINKFLNSDNTLTNQNWIIQEIITYSFTAIKDKDLDRKNYKDIWYVKICESLFNNCK